MTEANSPHYKRGVEDGTADAGMVSMCPGWPPIGPAPPDPRHAVMYQRGYDAGFCDAQPHQPCRNCRFED